MSIKSQLAAFIMTKCLLDKLKLHVKWLQIINHYSYTIIIQNGNISKHFIPSPRRTGLTESGGRSHMHTLTHAISYLVVQSSHI